MPRILIFGSRSFNNYTTFRQWMKVFLKPGNTIISGGASGTDAMAEKYAKEYGIEIEVFPADWKQYGRSAGIIRNEQMASECNSYVGFWDGKSRGTKDMHERLLKKQICGTLIYTEEVPEEPVIN